MKNKLTLNISNLLKSKTTLFIKDNQNLSGNRLTQFKWIFLLTVITLIGSCSFRKTNCQSNWKTTGFYTPIAKDFSSQLNKNIVIQNHKSLSFNREFLKTIKTEGWGKTRFDWYLGYYSNQWHKNNFPLNAMGHPLKIGAIAVDNNFIAKNTLVNIPSIQEILAINQFHAVDVGSAIKKQHIDIYTGEGESARKLSYRVTGKHQVCF